MLETIIEVPIKGETRRLYLYEAESAGSSTLIIYKRGSEPRDILTNSLAKQIASELMAKGCSVMYYNDRGVEDCKEKEKYYSARLEDFGSDLREIIDHVRDKYSERYSTIGLCGHSEGGIVSLIAASENDAVSFVVLLSTPLAAC